MVIPVTAGQLAAAGTNNRNPALWQSMATSPTVTTARDAAPAETVAAPSRVRMIAVLGAMVALGPLTIDMYLPALPRIADELGVSSSVAQLTLTGTLAGLALGQLVVGPLSDSLGRRRPLMAGIVLHMVASLVCLVAPDLAVLAAARAVQGMGAAAAMVVAVAVVGDLFSDSVAATVMSRLMLVLGVAPVLAPSLGRPSCCTRAGTGCSPRSSCWPVLCWWWRPWPCPRRCRRRTGVRCGFARSWRPTANFSATCVS